MRLLFSSTCLVYMHLFVELFMYNDDDISTPSYDSLSDNTIFFNIYFINKNVFNSL